MAAPYKGYPPPPQQEQYQPPLGPPPNHAPTASQDHYDPPPGPPPQSKHYSPPAGPPPSHAPASNLQAPPEYDDRPYHDWAAIPDTALLPPPPSLGHASSPTSNAPTTEALQAQEWCRRNPLYGPRHLSIPELRVKEDGGIRLIKPPGFAGDLYPMSGMPGMWKGRTKSGCRDLCLIGDLPLYAAQHERILLDPAQPFPKTIYYEVRIIGMGRSGRSDESSLALGFCAQPYPTWRLPGWERGSLGVHGDDGRRFVSDDQGGKDFTRPFRAGQTVGLGMTFSRPSESRLSAPVYPPPPDSAPLGAQLKVDVFFTRNGERDNGWDLHEELDVAELGVDGLDGRLDIYPAIGVFGGVDFEVIFNRAGWRWRC